MGEELASRASLGGRSVGEGLAGADAMRASGERRPDHSGGRGAPLPPRGRRRLKGRLRGSDPRPVAEFGTNIDDDLQLLDVKLKQLRLDFEQYFLGSRPREPSLLRGEVQKMVAYYANVPIQNTALRFRFNNLRARFFIFRRHWDETLRKIENGTYERHLFKAELHERERAGRHKKGGEASPVASRPTSSSASSGPRRRRSARSSAASPSASAWSSRAARRSSRRAPSSNGTLAWRALGRWINVAGPCRGSEALQRG